MHIPRWLAAMVGCFCVVLAFAAFQAQAIGQAEPITITAPPRPGQLRTVTTTIGASGIILAPTSGKGFVVTHIAFATDTGAITTTARPVLEMDGVPLFVLDSSGVAGFGQGFHTSLDTGLQVPPGSVLTVRVGNYVPIGQVVTVLGYVW